MKLSQALRLGAQALTPTRYNLFKFSATNYLEGGCALGCALYALTNGDAPYQWLENINRGWGTPSTFNDLKLIREFEGLESADDERLRGIYNYIVDRFDQKGDSVEQLAAYYENLGL